jgi:hypothetical protein
MSIARAQLRWSSIENHKHTVTHYAPRSTFSPVNPRCVPPACTTNHTPRIRGRLSRGYCHQTIGKYIKSEYRRMLMIQSHSTTLLCCLAVRAAWHVLRAIVYFAKVISFWVCLQ